jgi:amidase
LQASRTDGIDRFLAEHRLDALIAPSYAPAPRIDIAAGGSGWGWTSRLAAVAGYPHLTVPMGLVMGLPVGLSFIGPAWSDAEMLRLGYAFEQLAQARRAPLYLPTLEEEQAAFAPAAPAAVELQARARTAISSEA